MGIVQRAVLASSKIVQCAVHVVLQEHVWIVPVPVPRSGHLASSLPFEPQCSMICTRLTHSRRLPSSYACARGETVARNQRTIAVCSTRLQIDARN